MDEQNKGVETTNEQAPVVQEPDYKALYEQEKAEKAKIAEDRDNYKNGLLKAKGYSVNDATGDKLPDVPSVEEIVKKVLDEKSSTSQSESEEVRKLREEVKIKDEVIVSLSNRSQVNTATSGGSSSEKEITNTKGASYWTQEQEAALRAKGLNPDIVAKVAQNPSGNMNISPLLNKK